LSAFRRLSIDQSREGTAQALSTVLAHSSNRIPSG